MAFATLKTAQVAALSVNAVTAAYYDFYRFPCVRSIGYNYLRYARLCRGVCGDVQLPETLRRLIRGATAWASSSRAIGATAKAKMGCDPTRSEQAQSGSARCLSEPTVRRKITPNEMGRSAGWLGWSSSVPLRRKSLHESARARSQALSLLQLPLALAARLARRTPTFRASSSTPSGQSLCRIDG
jgi:hypothetical protein